MTNTLDQTIRDTTANERAVRTQVEKQVADLTQREDRLIDLAADGTLPRETIRTKLTKQYASNAKTPKTSYHPLLMI